MIHELDKLFGQRNYKGVIVERIIGGYRVLDSNVKTPQEVDQVLDQAAQHLKNSITVQNNGSIESQHS